MLSKLQSIGMALLSMLGLTACAQNTERPVHIESKTFRQMNAQSGHVPGSDDTMQVATFGAGCFWCTEAQFQQLKGVSRVVSGYMGGSVPDPSYKQVCTGTTGHAEVTNVYYDPREISFDELLAAFWTAHDPTQLNRQGNDVGTQYRSAIFYHTEEQKRIAEHYRKELDASGAFRAPIVTEITPASTFYEAEDYHQNYYAQNGDQGYCRMVIQPKLEKFRTVFASKLKDR